MVRRNEIDPRYYHHALSYPYEYGVARRVSRDHSEGELNSLIREGVRSEGTKIMIIQQGHTYMSRREGERPIQQFIHGVTDGLQHNPGDF